MPTRERVRDRGQRWARAAQSQLAAELRESRIMAGVGQQHVAKAAGLTQTQVSRVERTAGSAPRLDDLSMHAAALGLRLSVRLYPAGSPLRDAAQLKLIARLRSEVDAQFSWRTEVPVSGDRDLRAWDVQLGEPLVIGIDAETRLHDMQALQRRLELKWRDSGVPRVVLVVAETRHNRRVLREHRAALSSTLPLDSAEVLGALRAGLHPKANGILVLSTNVSRGACRRNNPAA